MTLFRLVYREILFRKLSFALAVLAVLFAAGGLTAQVLLLAQHDLRTDQLVVAKEQETETLMRKHEDEVRKDMKNLGFNLRILPRGVNLLEFFAKDYADKYMPEDYADRLARSKIVSINHLLPILQQRTEWPERSVSAVNLVGTRGEIPIAFQEKKKAFIDAVPQGKIILGHLLRFDLKPGGVLTFQGRKFTVHKIHEQRGDQDDISVWVHLKDAQEMLEKKGLINGMLALGCNCAADRLSVIRDEIASVLPDTQVEEYVTRATVRAEARTRAEKLAKDQVQRERDHRQSLREEKEAFAALVVPMLLVVACGWVGLLALANVRERRAEVGLLRALGLRSRQLFLLFLSRAFLVGVAGGVGGMIAGAMVSVLVAEAPALAWEALASHGPLLAAASFGAALVSTLAAWPPALLAVKDDPAIVLQQES